MTQTLDLLTSNQDERILCCYLNNTSRIQVAQIANVLDWYFERVVFPGQHLLFEALPNAELEIYGGTPVSAILSNRISCNFLRVNEEMSEDLSEKCLAIRL